MGHQHGRLGVRLAGPGEQQAAVLEPLKLAGLEHVGIQRRQGSNELFKLGIIFQRMVGVGDRAAADEGAQIFYSLVAVNGFLALRHSRGSARRKAQRAHQHNSSQNNNDC